MSNRYLLVRKHTRFSKIRKETKIIRYFAPFVFYYFLPIDLTRQSFFPNLREHTIRTKTKINHHGPDLLLRAKTSSSHYLDRKIDTHKQKRNRCEHPLRPQDGSFKAHFLFSYIIDVEEKTTPYSLSLYHFLGAKFEIQTFYYWVI